MKKTFTSITDEAMVALRDHECHIEYRIRVTHHTMREFWEVTFPEGTEEGNNGFYRDISIPEDYDPYYKQGPSVPETVRFFRLPDGSLFVEYLLDEKGLQVFQGELPSFEKDGDFKIWRKKSPFEKWEIVGNSPYAKEFLKEHEGDPQLFKQPYLQDMYNHILQEDPRKWVEMVK